MANNYEFFKLPVNITGRHAKMAKELWTLSPGSARTGESAAERSKETEQERRERTFFNRLVDLYKVAPVIGYLEERKGRRDTSADDSATVFAEQMNREKEELETIMTMLLMAEYAESGLYTQEEAVRQAFRGPSTDEEYQKCIELFNAYVLGGIEIMYEELILKRSSYENEYSNHTNTAALMEFLRRYGLGRK